jgi:hypothetical protein
MHTSTYIYISIRLAHVQRGKTAPGKGPIMGTLHMLATIQHYILVLFLHAPSMYYLIVRLSYFDLVFGMANTMHHFQIKLIRQDYMHTTMNVKTVPILYVQ